MKKRGFVKLIGLAGVALAGVAALISNYANERAMEETIEAKVNEALAKRENRDEEESE